jgi:dihydroxyacid dehydratase/phosphogluconate dehydratase
MDIVQNSCPGAGACGGMYTANTMASAIEALGMSLPYSSSIPAEDPLKLEECRLAGKYLLELLKHDLKPRDIITRKSLNNAIAVVMALGGSTNAVLHLIAIARCTPMPWLQCLFSMKASIMVWCRIQSVFPLDCFLRRHSGMLPALMVELLEFGITLCLYSLA